MDTQKLRHLLAIVEHGTFSDAARAASEKVPCSTMASKCRSFWVSMRSPHGLLANFSFEL